MTSEYNKKRGIMRQNRRVERRLIDGRLTAVRPYVVHGKPATYSNWGCRCVSCTEAHARYIAEKREVRYASRAEIDGRLVAIKTPTHGTNSTYANWGCRCVSCVLAHYDHRDDQRNREAAT